MPLHHNYPELFLMACTALTAVVWVHHIVAPQKLLSWLPEWFRTRIVRNTKVNFMLFVCPACLAGQLALWSCVAYWCMGWPLEYELFVILLSMYMASWLEKQILR